MPSDITTLVIASRNGNREALDVLMPMIYQQLCRLARVRMRHERADHTLETAALVHEAYLKLVQIRQVEWRDRAHFFAMASRVMRRILVDYAERRRTRKRQGELVRVNLEEDLVADVALDAETILIIEEALSGLEEISPRSCRVVECRYFGGLSVEETAAGLGISVASIKRDLRFAHAWLARTLLHGTNHEHASSGTNRGTFP
jgi:RNA polymerase sigma factor (TIGR02999 family)